MMRYKAGAVASLFLGPLLTSFKKKEWIFLVEGYIMLNPILINQDQLTSSDSYVNNEWC